jgi:hypothetical protein
MIRLVKKSSENLNIGKRLGDIDDQLIGAMFQLAIDNGLSEAANELFWRDSRCQSEAHYFKTGLLHVSEFYADWNPVLSSALWGIWNTIQLSGRDLEEMSLERQAVHFARYKRLVSDAILHFADGDAIRHFSDGDPFTSELSTTAQNMLRHEFIFDHAIESLRTLGIEIRDSYGQFARVGNDQ